MRKSILKLTELTAILFLFTTGTFASPSRNLTVFAEPNMVIALTKIARLYSQKSNVIVSVNFNSSYDLISEIDSGEPVDIFISAHHKLIESLHQKGLVDVYNVGYIAGDELVLATSKSNPNIPAELAEKKLSLEESLKILDQNKLTLIIDNNGNSSGEIGDMVIENLDLNDIQLFRKLSEDKTQFLNIVKSNNQNYALLLKSQVSNENDFQILASKNDLNIFYQAMVIAGDNMEIAREFLKFLKSDSAKIIFKQSGFLIN